MEDFREFDRKWHKNAQLAWDTISCKSTKGIPTWMLNVMDWDLLEKVSGHSSGQYESKPEDVYRQFQLACGTCMIDQWIPRNPLTMTKQGFSSATPRKAATGAEEIELDGMVINSPEAVAEHIERYVLPSLREERKNATAAEDKIIDALITAEVATQSSFGMNMLKVPYDGFQSFPTFRYGEYGYVNYFSAYALYPELMAKDFALQADLAVVKNRQSARAIMEGGLPRILRLDHDMADSRSTLVDIKSLDAIWFPQFERSIRPLVEAGIRLIWHCDGNLMQMVPRLIGCGVGGFQGFQYEDGMDYEKICALTARDGNPLAIWAGVSVTTTLPHGTPDMVRRQLKWLVDYGPPVGLFLAASSSIAPGTNQTNVQTLIEGLNYYREVGR